MTDRAAASRKQPLLVLDFDGVVCDSAEECFVSSWIAYHKLYRGEQCGEPPAAGRAEFRALRPYVRSGEDFVMIQALIARAEKVGSQAEFDRAWEGPGSPSRDTFKDLFYRARTDLLMKDRQAWLSMNRIYPHVSEALARLPSGAHFYILSTKKSQFVLETLSANHVPVPIEKVIDSGKEPKLPIVERLRETLTCERAFFVEDQIDALRGNPYPRIQCFLASWGYVQMGWLREPHGITVLTPEGFAGLLASEFS